jgi:hypothetical protein
VVPSTELGTNSVRAMAFQKTEKNFEAPVLYTFDTPVPLPRNLQRLPVPTNDLDEQQINLVAQMHRKQSEPGSANK